MKRRRKGHRLLIFAVLALLCLTHPPNASCSSDPSAEEKSEKQEKGAKEKSEKGEKIKLDYRMVETQNLLLFYGFQEQDYILKHLSRCYENTMHYYKSFFGYSPSEKVTVFLNDMDDYGYAGTTTIPNNWITLGIEPFEYVYDTCPTNERMNWVMNHELVHVLASDQAAGSDRFFRKFFRGKVMATDEDPISMWYSYLTNPRRYAPRWYHEGIAVFMETWLAGGIGRSLTGYDEMTFRAMVRDGSFFYDVVGLESEGTAVDFQIGQNSYLYGTRFVSYLAYRYGPEKIIEWMKRGEGSKRYFSTQFEHVFGVPLKDEWKRWIAFEREWQGENLKTIRQYPVTPVCEIPCRPLGSVSREFLDPAGQEIYVAVNYPGEFSHIAAIDIATGQIRKICEIATPALYYVAALAYDPSDQKLFFTTDNSRSWRDLNVVDIKTGEKKVLLKDCRIGDLAFNRQDRSIWGIQHHNGQSRIVRIPHPYNEWQVMLILPYGKDMFDIDVSPDGRYLTGTLSEISGRQLLIRMETGKLIAMDESYDVLWEFQDNTPENFVFSADGKYLFGTSYYSGVSNVYRYDFSAQKMDAISNCEIGYFRPLLLSEETILAFQYSGKGFVPVIIPNDVIEDIAPIRYLGQAVVDEHPIVKDWILQPPSAIDIDSLTISSSRYKAFKRLGITSWYPIIEGYKDYIGLGFRLNLMDPVGMNGLDLAGSYSPSDELSSNEKPHFRFRYRRFPWTLSGYWNRADFYDLFGPTKVSRKGGAVIAGYDNFITVDHPKSLDYSFRVAKYWNMERLPLYQNIATSYDDFYAIVAQIGYTNLRRTIGGTEPEKGLALTVGSYGSYVLNEFYPLIHADLDYGFLLPLDHSSIWLRSSAGYSFGDRSEPLANFYFGGFGNNWIDHAEVNRYREYYSFPGVELNDIGGKNYAKAMLEWTLPPIRFKRAGFSALYMNWMRFALFTTGIVTNIDAEEYQRKVADAGVQMNMKVVIFSSLESTFSLGYAFAFEEGSRPERELMVSLKILR